MPLDPQCQALIDAVNASGATPFDQADPIASRVAYQNTTAIYRHDVPELAEVKDDAFAGADGPVDIRLYRPLGETNPSPALVFFHGGGWAAGDLETHDHVCRYLAGGAGAVIVSVNYRLAPEHPFPAAIDDCLASVNWVHRYAEQLAIDPERIAVGGDSAGGNLAAAVCQLLRDDPGIEPCFQLLIYPACDFTADNASLRDNGNGYLLTREAMERFIDWYVPDKQQRTDPRASPQLAKSLAGLPQAYIASAEFDPLRDEARVYAESLLAAGVPVQHKCYAGMVHGFARMGGKVDAGIQCLDDCIAQLKRAFQE